MIKRFFRIISKFKILIPFYLIIFHCSLPDDPTKATPRNLKYDKELYTLYIGDEFKAVASVEYAVDSFTITPQLPPGLNFDKSTGLIMGKCDSSLSQTSFTIQAFNKNGSTACILKIEIFPNPLFIVQPKDNIVKINDSVTFTVKATGKNPLKFSWLKNDSIIPGKDSSFLKIQSASYADSGSYQCKVVDSLGKTALSNKAHLQIVDTGTVISTDNVPPVISRIKPQKDSAITNSTSYTIKVNCTDSSGVASVTGTMGAQVFSGTRDTGNDWTIQVSGLVVNTYNKVTVTATDKSTKGNKATLDYFVKYDPTIQDLEPPTVYFANPLKDTAIDVDSFTVSVICKDPSGILSLTGDHDGTAFTLNKSPAADSIWTGTVKGLPLGAFATIRLIATDASPAQNKDSISVRIKYSNDSEGPVMTRTTPAKDSASTNSSSYTIKITCTDPSGVASVKGTLGSQTFIGTKGSVNDWTILVSGLVANTYSKITVTAVDSSAKANPSILEYHIKYDPTMTDNEPPIVYFVNPFKDTTIDIDSISVTAVCKDPSGIASLVGLSGETPFTMIKSATADSIWTGTAKGFSAGALTTIKLVATDASPAQNKDSISVRIKYSNDSEGPVMTRITPAKDSASTNSSSYTIKITCTDPSGVASVKGTLGTQTFIGTKGSANDWTILVSGLVANTYSKITVTAVDSSVKANPSILEYYIKYDPTMSDNEPPTVYFVNPLKDTTIGIDSFSVTAVCKDPSGIGSLVGLSGETPFTMVKSTTADSIWTGTAKGFSAGALTTIKLIATDASPAQNKDSISVHIKYDNDAAGPVITKITPTGDSVSTNLTSYTISISCTDPSGVASVKGTLGSQSFTGIKSATGNTWTIAVTGLVVNTVNKVVITAIDSSIRANPSTMNFYITSDPTMGDIEPPRLYFVSPSKDTIVGADSFAISAVCKDASGISTLTGIYGAATFSMSKSATIDSIWTGTVKGLLPGVYATIKLIATDASTAKNKDSISVRIKYDNDVTGPVISKITPAGDSVSTNATNYAITISCADTSGIISVKGTLGSQSFIGARGTGNTWTIPVTGLAENVFNAVTVTATDSSLRANKTVDTLYIKYDPTLDDVDGPIIKLISGPTSGSVILNAAIQIIDSIVDPSQVDTVYWTKNSVVKKVMPLVSGTASQYTLNDTISEGKFDTLVVTAVDKSSHHNHSIQKIALKYVKAPAISVQPVSQSVCPGTKASFSVTATGTAPLSYQWREGATTPVDISGATSSTYEPSTTTAGQKILSCVISNGSGTNVVSSLCTLTVRSSSSVPASISGPASICSGEQLTLSVSGGTLGTGATWRWYSNSTFTTAVGSGSSITLTPTASTTYYVRAEGTCETTAAISKAISINSLSTAATSINATATSVCSGIPVTLSVSGGSLGSGATWKWYINSACTQAATGTALQSNGSQFQVTPGATTTYYVRAEGICNTTTPTSGKTITIMSESTEATAISASNQNFCSGDSVTLTVSGGELGDNASWVWYTDAGCTKKAAGRIIRTNGSKINVAPVTTTNYYVRAEGCNVTLAIHTKISPLATPTILQQPVSKHNDCGSAFVTFDVVASGVNSEDELSYQWYKDDIALVDAAGAIGGTTTNSLQFFGMTDGKYHCVITSSITGCAISTDTVNYTYGPCQE